MKTTIFLLAFAISAMAGSTPTGTPPLRDALKLASKKKDASGMKALLAKVRDQKLSDAAQDGLATELGRSLSAFKKNLDVELEVIKTLGEIGSKRAIAPLKKFAFQKKAKRDRDIALQVAALDALGKHRNPKLLSNFEKIAKTRNIEVAKAAYKGLGHYGGSKAKVRKRVTEFLIKRLNLEYPAYSNSTGKWIGEETRRRWAAVSVVIGRSLRSVSGEATISSPTDWQNWWRENKKKPWKDEPTS